MKKTLTLIVLIASASTIFAQGTVVFQNLTGLVQQWVSASDSSLEPVPVGGGYVQLIAATKGNPLPHPLGAYEAGSGFLPGYSSLDGFLAANPGWGVAWIPLSTGFVPQGPVPIDGAPGRFNDGSAWIFTPEGAEVDYVVIGWTGPYATYDAAYAADLANPDSSFLGMSAIATSPTGDPALVNPSTPVNLKFTFQGMTLAPAVIPEPTLVPPVGLGTVLLLLCRRHGLGVALTR